MQAQIQSEAIPREKADYFRFPARTSSLLADEPVHRPAGTHHNT